MDNATDEIEKVNQVFVYFQSKLPGMADFGLKVLIALLILFIGSKLIKWSLALIKKPFLRAGLEEGSVHFLNSLVKALLYIILIAGLATYLGVKEASIAALLGSMGVGIVLALKESLANLAGGFILLLMKPFIIGDYIKEDVRGNEGTVEKIDLFYTTLITPDNQTVSVPNGSLSNTSLTNLSKQSKRQLRLVVGIAYESNLRGAKDILQGILEADEAIMKEEPIEIFVDSLSAGSVELGFRAWVSPAEYWPAKWRILELVKCKFDENEIEIPYNKIDVSIKKPIL